MAQNRTAGPESPGLIGEVFALRSLACLSIVLLHALNRAVPEEHALLDFVKLLLTFGTPAFVFISEVVLAGAYPERVPGAFWSKRVRYLLLPYLVFGTFYAFVKGADVWLREGGSLLAAAGGFWWRHVLLGDYHGYFILIIFQFYALHVLFNRWKLYRRSPGAVIGTALAVNAAYLAVFNFLPAPGGAIMGYVWEKWFWIPFFGWVFYFAAAYYAGRRYADFLRAVRRRTGLLLLLPLLTGAALALSMRFGWLTDISSKRIDMLFFTISVILAALALVSRLKRPPAPLVWVSRHSFGIYLVHPLYMAVLVPILPRLGLPADGWAGTAVLFFGSLLASAATVQALWRIPGGEWLVGRAGVGLPPAASRGGVAAPLRPPAEAAAVSRSPGSRR